MGIFFSHILIAAPLDSLAQNEDWSERH